MHLIRGAKISSLSCTEMSCHYMIAMRVCGTIVLSGGKTSHENISDDQSSSPVNKPEPSRATSVPAPQLKVPSASNGAVSEFYLLLLYYNFGPGTPDAEPSVVQRGKGDDTLYYFVDSEVALGPPYRRPFSTARTP